MRPALEKLWVVFLVLLVLMVGIIAAMIMINNTTVSSGTQAETIYLIAHHEYLFLGRIMPYVIATFCICILLIGIITVYIRKENEKAAKNN